MKNQKMPTLAENQEFWAEQLPNFEAKYWLPSHFEYVIFDMEQGNYVIKDGLNKDFEVDATEIWHRVNTGWAMWKKAINFSRKQAQAVPEGFEQAYSEIFSPIVKRPYPRLENGDYKYIEINQGWKLWQAAKAQAVPEGFLLVGSKDLLDLTVAINALDLATHTESKTNEVREMWQDIALKLMALGEAQEQSHD